MLCFVGDANGADHFRRLLYPVIDQFAACFVGADVNADDVSIGQVVVVGDDRFEKLGRGH
jgi:hypothetical protein